MATLLEDLEEINYLANKLANNKVANFAYTQEAYEYNKIDGVSEYDVNNAQNIPIADAETLDVNSTVLDKGYRSQASSITRMLMNHFLGRTSYNLNKVVDLVKQGFSAFNKAIGKPKGIATLDENGFLSKEQTNPAMLMTSNKGKVKDFLFSGKTPTFKTIGWGDRNEYDLLLARSINEKEDIILRIEATYVRAYIYNGKTMSMLGASFSAPSTPIFLCEYKNYALFYCVQSTQTAFNVFISKFNFNNKTFTTKTVEYDKYSGSNSITVTVNFNKKTACFDMIENNIKVNTSSGGYTSRALISVDLETFTETGKSLYIPNIVVSGQSYISNFSVLSDDFLVLYQTSSPNYKLYVYSISVLENTNNTAVSLVSIIGVPGFSVRERTKTFIGLINGNQGIVVDNGNFYKVSVNVGGNLYESAVSLLNGYLFFISNLPVAGSNGFTTVKQVYKNDKLCTTLSYAGTYTPVYDSVFYADGALIDMENSENVIKSNYFKNFIVASDKRAYTLNYDSDDGYIICEITNVLD